MASEVSIINEALQELGAGRITSRTEDSVAARAANAIFDDTRDQLIERYNWSFAIKRAKLAANAIAPAFEYSNAYDFPSDCLRVILPRDYDTDWTIEGRQILTDWGAPLEVRYIARISDVNQMNPLFRRALAMELAAKLCETLTQSNSKQETALFKRDEAIAEAKRLGAIQKLPVDPREDSWIAERN